MSSLRECPPLLVDEDDHVDMADIDVYRHLEDVDIIYLCLVELHNRLIGRLCPNLQVLITRNLSHVTVKYVFLQYFLFYNLELPT